MSSQMSSSQCSSASSRGQRQNPFRPGSGPGRGPGSCSGSVTPSEASSASSVVGSRPQRLSQPHRRAASSSNASSVASSRPSRTESQDAFQPQPRASVVHSSRDFLKTAEQRELFDRLDVDGDGHVDQDEILQAVEDGQLDHAREFAAHHEHDDITRDQLDNAIHQALFDKLDVNKDGIVSRHELAEAAQLGLLGDVRHLAKFKAKKMPVDGMGRPACVATHEPGLHTYMRESKKPIELTKWLKGMEGSAGLNSDSLAVDEFLSGNKGRKSFTNDPTQHSNIAAVAFNRTDELSQQPIFDDEYRSMFTDAGGLMQTDHDKAVEKQSKKCMDHVNMYTEIPGVVFNKECARVKRRTDLKTAQGNERNTKTMYGNSAGQGATLQACRKRPMSGGQMESNVGVLMFGSNRGCHLQETLAQIKSTDGRAGQLSSERFRG